MSKTSIDRLGERLRNAPISSADLETLSAYRETFRSSYIAVVAALRDELGYELTGRPAKSTTAIIEKVRRERIRLSQVQDIAGVRVLVPTLVAQDELANQLTHRFAQSTVLDRRAKPSNGYRAVHVVVRPFSLPVEVQIRTQLQHKWAEISEKVSDTVDASIKYGGGPSSIRELLLEYSRLALRIENGGRRIDDLLARSKSAASSRSPHQAELESMNTELESVRVENRELSNVLQAELDKFANIATKQGKEF
jgi:ppGpp synthetase/RelA/SpoT-type nucleotidyltranferase